LSDVRLKNRAQLNVLLGFRITDLDWEKIKKIFAAAMQRYERNSGLSKTYDTFWNYDLKGSKPARKLLEGSATTNLPHNIVKFASNTEVIIGSDDSAFINSFWCSHFLSSTVSIFYFKLINNILGFNYIISHFLPDVERSCTFCNIAGLPEEEDETPLHLFYSCSISERMLENFYNKILGTGISRQEFFGVPNRDNKASNYIIFLIGILVKKYFWDCKMRTSLPQQDNLEHFVFNELKLISRVSKKYRIYIQDSELTNETKILLRRG
jgi:hypothetical protein